MTLWEYLAHRVAFATSVIGSLTLAPLLVLIFPAVFLIALGFQYEENHPRRKR